jgi:protein phosphatase
MSVKNPQLHGMGTTVTACVIHENLLTAAHVGDSRLYLLRGGEIKQMTKDHSLVEMLIENGTITKEDAKSHPQKNVITRAIGTSNTVDTDTYEFPVTEGDIILLCSDGLTNMIDEEKILSLVWGKKSFENLAQKLVKEAENSGGIDNITAVLIKL